MLVNNGLVIFEVQDLTETDVHCRVVVGGELSNRKSMSFPNKVLHQIYLSEQDKDDLLFGIRNGVDFVAASFVSCKQDLLDLRGFLHANGGEDIDIIAKIENRAGVDNIEEISEVCDGIMVARGDLGVEVPFTELPAIQKYLITKCRLLGKRVITATEMLESMIHNPRPTRAEATDVANAIHDRVDAISHATCGMAIDIGAKVIVVTSMSGMTVRMVSRFRAPTDIVGMATNKRVWYKLSLSWGVLPVLSEQFNSTDVLFYHALRAARDTMHLQPGDNVVMAGGITNGKSGNTNLIKIEAV